MRARTLLPPGWRWRRVWQAFLKAAHKKRTFDVIVAETAPGVEGRQTAVSLAEAEAAAGAMKERKAMATAESQRKRKRASELEAASDTAPAAAEGGDEGRDGRQRGR